MTQTNNKNAGWSQAFAVACVLFSSHAGGGFATGNQATQYYVKYGWTAPIMAVAAMAVLALTIRECMIMYNQNKLGSYKELFEHMWHPFDKLEILWEVYFYIMVIMAVGAVIAGAASLFAQMGLSYGIGVIIVGIMLMILTMFGAKLVTNASTIMSVGILGCCAVIFILGISARTTEISTVMAARETTGGFFKPALQVFTYAGFQSVVIPTMIKCGRPLENTKNATRAMFIAFVMNAAALALSCFMLLGWYPEFTAAGATTLPTLYICQQLNMPFLPVIYSVFLFLCFISTGVTTVFGLVSRFENAKAISFIPTITMRRAGIAVIAMGAAMSVSMLGLTNIIKYGYGYCGYLGIAVIIVPMLTIGAYKNRKFAREQQGTAAGIGRAATDNA